ncbi:hypothetical protein D3C72_2202460 [compost metagenome]
MSISLRTPCGTAVTRVSRHCGMPNSTRMASARAIREALRIGTSSAGNGLSAAATAISRLSSTLNCANSWATWNERAMPERVIARGVRPMIDWLLNRISPRLGFK